MWKMQIIHLLSVSISTANSIILKKIITIIVVRKNRVIVISHPQNINKKGYDIPIVQYFSVMRAIQQTTLKLDWMIKFSRLDPTHVWLAI